MKKFLQPEIFIAALLTVLGILAMLGWRLHMPALIQIKAGVIGMVFNTALCISLLGLALLLPVIHSNYRKAQVWLAWLVTGIATLVLLEYIVEFPLRIDQPNLHAWLPDGNPHPGRMAPHTGAGLLLSGLILILMQHVKSRWTGILVQIGTLLIIAIGTIGLTAYNFRLELYFPDFELVRMAPLAAFALILTGIALWLNWRKSEWYTSRQYFKEDEKIAVTSVATLIIVVLCAGIAGFSVSETALEQSLTNSLTTALNSRITLIQSEIKQSLNLVKSTSIRPGLVRLIKQLDNPAERDQTVMELKHIGNSILGAGFSGMQILSPSGKELLRLGKLVQAPELYGGLTTEIPSLLLWDDGFYLRTSFNIFDGRKLIATFVADQPLTLMSEQFLSSNQLGKTGTTVMCFVRPSYLDCFPERFNQNAFRIPRMDKFGKALPMTYTEHGSEGIITAVDYRGHPVIAAYGQVNESGLGLVVKQDSQELYSPISDRLLPSLILFVLFVTLAAWILHRQIKRMATKLLDSETEAKRAAQDLILKESLLRTVTDTMPLLVAFIDVNQRYRYCNKSYLEKFGIQAQEILGKTINEFLGTETYQTLLPYISKVLNGERCQYELQLNIRDLRLVMEGHYIPQFAADGQITGFYAMLIDVTQTRQRERRLQHRASTDGMTGLLNRMAFTAVLDEQILLHADKGQPLALLYLDIDYFKSINDTLGHEAGDEVIKAFAANIRKAVRNTDKVARLGGDEFVILLTMVKSERVAESIARKLTQKVTQPMTINGRLMQITTSIGLAYSSNPQFSAKAFLNHADQALYEAKGAGRNNYKIKIV